MITIQYLDLNEDSVLIDIGGGSPQTGYGFFSSIVKDHVKKIYILDPNVNLDKKVENNIEFVPKNANYESLKELLTTQEVTHIACISVFEHIEDSVRNEIISAINDHFHGESFVSTFEYHPKQIHFEYQLTAKTVSELFSNFTRFYLTEYSASPVLCENGFAKKQRISLRNLKFKMKKTYIPRWYPLAVKFVKSSP